jgi:hypothetical protein
MALRWRSVGGGSGGKALVMSDHVPPGRGADDEAIEEPENSTVDDWLGQQVDADAELADELLEETGGDAEEAERRFRQRSHEDRPDRLPTEHRRT